MKNRGRRLDIAYILYRILNVIVSRLPDVNQPNRELDGWQYRLCLNKPDRKAAFWPNWVRAGAIETISDGTFRWGGENAIKIPLR